MTRYISLRLLLVVPIFALMAMMNSGCASALGTLSYGIFGPAANPAKYVLPKEPTLVLVENYRNPSAAEFDADQVASEVTDDLKKNNVAPIVDLDKLLAIRDADPNKYRTMKIQDIGRAVGAKQIVYVDLVAAAVELDPSQRALHGKAAARVRVVEVASGDTRWPAGMAEGYPVESEIPYNDADPRIATAMNGQMISELSEQIGNLFHEWKPENERGSYDK